MDQNAITASHESQSDLEGSLQQLKLQDCAYFLRTGTCAFGSKCRYNHPTVETPQAFLVKGNAENLPERLGQTECQFFMKTGVCKFGPACWYHHPRPNSGTSGSEQLQLNFLGLPLRPSEKECTYYLQTGSCKYGITCKFHHPQPTAADSTQPSSKSPIHTSNGVSMPTPLAYKEPGYAWRVDGTSFVPFTVGIPSPLSVGMVTSSPQHVLGSELNFSQSQEHSTTGIRLPRPMATILHGQPIFPDRPGQPDCHHYMKTGDCKFGMNCKYHHPKDRSMSLPFGLSPMGLPLRPGNQACPYYVKHRICKFGPVCKFDHPPVNVLPHSPPYSPSTSSINEVPVAPFLPDSSLSVSLRSAVSEGLQHSVSDSQVTLTESITMRPI